MSLDRKDLLGILEKAMTMEVEGREFYEKAAEITKDAAGKKMFHSFAADEAQHYATLRKQHEALSGGGAWMSAASLLDREPARWQAPSVFPTEDHEVTAAISADANDVEALKLALKAEQESYDLYSKSAKESQEPEAHAMFNYLAAEEIGHYRLLDSALDYLGRTSTFFLVEERSLNEG